MASGNQSQTGNFLTLEHSPIRSGGSLGFYRSVDRSIHYSRKKIPAEIEMGISQNRPLPPHMTPRLVPVLFSRERRLQQKKQRLQYFTNFQPELKKTGRAKEAADASTCRSWRKNETRTGLRCTDAAPENLNMIQLT
jgi:hypothetical protein